MIPMARVTSDHIPCVIQIGTSVPKAQSFWFKNYWLDHADFMDFVKLAWGMNARSNSFASKVTTKFKLL
jgi:hypothetical protein